MSYRTLEEEGEDKAQQAVARGSLPVREQESPSTTYKEKEFEKDGTPKNLRGRKLVL